MNDLIVSGIKAGSMIRIAFKNDTLIVDPTTGYRIQQQELFIPITLYANRYLKKLVTGEIGIYNSQRIIINLPVPKGTTAKSQ